MHAIIFYLRFYLGILSINIYSKKIYIECLLCRCSLALKVGKLSLELHTAAFLIITLNIFLIQKRLKICAL